MKSEQTPREERAVPAAEGREEQVPYEAPVVQSVKLSDEAAEALT